MDSILYKAFEECNYQVCTDTRRIIEGCLFIALKGENFNGNDFAKQALEAGAKFVVVDEEQPDLGRQAISVNDALKALQQLANQHRRSFDIPVLGITGSNGKTTSKELITSVLNKKYKAYSTPGNFNNHIGLPLTILGMPQDTEILVLEMGDNHMGEIHELCLIGEPTHGIVTNVGKDHIEGFGSFENNKLAKKELFDYLESSKGISLVPEFEPDVIEMTASLKSSQVLRTDLIQLDSDPYVCFETTSGKKVNTHFIGDYNFKNIEMAYYVGRLFSVPENSILEAIRNYQPRNNRSQFIESKNNKIFLDAYNANPSSVELALLSFAKQELAKTRIVILGDMLELGEESENEHRNIRELVSQLNLLAYFVGKEYGKVVSDECSYKDTEALIAKLQSHPVQNAQILIKGSRGIRLERVLDYL